MKFNITLLALALSASFTFAADEPAKAAGEKPKHNPEEAFKKKDTNADGKLSKEEFTANAKDAAKSEKQFGNKDKDKDNFVTKEEFTAPGKKKAA